MTQLFAFVLCVLASKAVLDVWFKGSIFAWYRAWAELLRDAGEWWLSQKFGELMTCRFCFSYHSSLWLSLFCLPVLPWWALVPWWLAVRTATAFLDQFEESLDVKINHMSSATPESSKGNNDVRETTDGADSGTLPTDSGTGLFD
jgi:hypothetical protein